MAMDMDGMGIHSTPTRSKVGENQLDRLVKRQNEPEGTYAGSVLSACTTVNEGAVRLVDRRFGVGKKVSIESNASE